MFRVRSNVSDALRQLKALTTGPNSIYKIAGTQLRDAILDEFDVLVRETPQWTGTTAASWEIGFPSDVTGIVETQPERKREEALSKGTEPACGIAMSKARTSLTSDLSKYKTQDIILINEAPGFDRAEEGPVRPVNTPPGALKRFEARIDTLDILVDFPKL